LLVGTSTADTAYGTAPLQVSTEGNTVDSGIFLRNSSSSAFSAQLRLGTSRGTKASPTVVSSGDTVASIHGMGYDGSTWQRAASIDVAVDGTPGANDMPGRLVFSTTADGASSPTERMRIRNNGSVLIGCTTENARGLTISPQGSGSSPTIGFSKNNDGNANACAFLNAGTIIGTISYDVTSTAYNTSSDYRLKENVVPLTGAVDRLNQLQVHRFNFIAEPGKIVDGFIAHEAQAVVPECVTGEKDAVDDDGNPVYQGIDQSKLVPLLTAALQEALQKIDAMEARLAALEGA
jgi:hypothetical protein